MSVTSGFFNSINRDRLYDARQFSSLFNGIIRDGVFMSLGGRLMISESSVDLRVEMAPGRAWFDGGWLDNDAPEPINLELSDLLFPRIDAVVMDFDSQSSGRANTVKVIKGVASSNPVKPSLIRTALHNQYALAYVRLNANQTVITNADIENAVGTSDTPFVTGILETMNVDDLIAQWKSEYAIWLNASKASFNEFMTSSSEEFETKLQQWTNEFTSWQTTFQNEADQWKFLFEETATQWYSDQTSQFENWYNDTTTEFAAWESQFKQDANAWYLERRNEFDVWFQNIKNVLDDNVAANLYKMITDLDAKVTPAMVYSFTCDDDGTGGTVFNTTMTYPLNNAKSAWVMVEFTKDVAYGDPITIGGTAYELILADGSTREPGTVIFTNGSQRVMVVNNFTRKVIFDANAEVPELPFDVNGATVRVKNNGNLELQSTGSRNSTSTDYAENYFGVVGSDGNRMASLEVARRNGNQTDVGLMVNSPNGGTAGIKLKANSDGSFETEAPKPPILSNNGSIATTQWVNEVVVEELEEYTVPVTQTEKNKWNASGTITVTHSKSGNIHTLTGLPTTSGIYICQFRATAAFVEGNTFANGWVAKPVGEDTVLPNNAFVTGDVVSITVDVQNKKLGFKLGSGGGGGSIEPVIYVQTTAPTGSGVEDGQYWVKDSGYSLDVVVAEPTVPSDLPATCLYVAATTSDFLFPFVVTDTFTLLTRVNYGSAYVDGIERDAEVYFRVDGQWVLRTKWGGTLILCMENTAGTERTIVYNEADATWYTVFYYDDRTMGGIKNRAMIAGSEFNFDTRTFGATKFDIASVRGGCRDYLVGNYGNNPFILYDFDSGLVVKTITVPVAYYGKCGVGDYLVGRTTADVLSVLDIDTGVIIKSFTGIATNITSGDGTINTLYAARDASGFQSYMFAIDIDTGISSILNLTQFLGTTAFVIAIAGVK